jgi:hypothetical protein
MDFDEYSLLSLLTNVILQIFQNILKNWRIEVNCKHSFFTFQTYNIKFYPIKIGHVIGITQMEKTLVP